MKWKNAALIGVAVLGLVACHVSDPSDEIIQIGVDEELVVDMVQTIHNGNVELGLTFVSSTPYDCGGGGYDYNLFTTHNQVAIYLTSVLLPQPCSPGPTPAREQIPIPSQPGSYAISIGIGDLIQNTGSLDIDNQSFRLNLKQQHGITLNHTIMYRIPQYTIWGYAYHVDKQSEVNEQVLSELTSITETSSLTAGYYGLFNAVGPSNIQVLAPGIKTGAETFVYTLNKPFSQLTSVLTQLKQDLPADTDFKVFTWEGSVF